MSIIDQSQEADILANSVSSIMSFWSFTLFSHIFLWYNNSGVTTLYPFTMECNLSFSIISSSEKIEDQGELTISILLEIEWYYNHRIRLF